jgi:hypothetical protein
VGIEPACTWRFSSTQYTTAASGRRVQVQAADVIDLLDKQGSVEGLNVLVGWGLSSNARQI